MCSGPIPQQPPTIVAPAATQRRASSRYASGVTSSRMSCSAGVCRRSSVLEHEGVGVDADRELGRCRCRGDRRLHHLWLAAVEEQHLGAEIARRRAAASTIDSPDRRRGSPSSSSSCNVNEIHSGATCTWASSTSRTKLGFGDRGLCLRQPEVDERRLLQDEHVEDRARLVADEQVGPVRAEHRRQAAGDAHAGMAVGDLAWRSTPPRRSAGDRLARTTPAPRWNGIERVGVGGDHLGAGRDVRLVHAPHGVRVLDQRLRRPQRLAERCPDPGQLASGSAVEHRHTTHRRHRTAARPGRAGRRLGSGTSGLRRQAPGSYIAIRCQHGTAGVGHQVFVPTGVNCLPVAFLRPWACKHWSSA